MIDGIIKADGTSRLMRAELPATYEEFRAQCRAGTQPLDVLFNVLGWSQLPTFLNKANLLRDETANALGLNSDAVPNDAFMSLSRFNNNLGNEYLWAKLSNELVDVVSVATTTTNMKISVSGSNISIYTDIQIVNGTLSGVDAKKVSYHQGKGGYVKSNGNFYKLINHTGYSDSKAGYDVALVTIAKAPSGEIVGYVNSNNPNAYPVNDGYTYAPLGKLGAKVQMLTGSYRGTDKYGESNPTVLTFDSPPKIILMVGSYGSGSWTQWFGRGGITNSYYALGTDILQTTYQSGCGLGNTSNSTMYAKKSEDGKTIYWYDTGSAGAQFNALGVRYYWLVLC